MKKTKKLTGIVAAGLSLCISAALMAGAADFYGAGYDLEITKDMDNTYSSLLQGAKQVKYKGGNYSSSDQTMTLKVKKLKKGIFYTDVNKKAKPGESIPEGYSTEENDARSWELSLHASGLGSDVNGWGSMISVK